MKTEIIPVIHMIDNAQVLTNVKTCLECGIQKVFIINHVVSSGELINCAITVKGLYPNLWIGINRLGVPVKEVIATRFQKINGEPSINGVWCDETVTQRYADSPVMFGGVAFKYQPQPTDLKSACEQAKLYTHVATTSGDGTGKPAHLHKIRLIREYLGQHPMAIASGITAENIGDYNGLADYLLVASSITDNKEMIIKEKLSELLSKI